MGVKNIILTDPDLIEKSNLNRQFLFRNEHIGFRFAWAACVSSAQDLFRLLDQCDQQQIN